MSEQGRTPTIQSLFCIPEVKQKGARRLNGWKKEGPEQHGPFFGAAYGFSTGRVPKSGASFAEKSVDCEVFGQAIGFWRWSNFLHSQPTAGKKALHVNLDETGIRMHQVAGKGMLVHAAILEKRKAASLTQRCS